MSKQIQKSLQICLSKIKISNKHIQHQLRGYKKPHKTPSLAVSTKEKENDDVTLSDIDKFLFENFRSLYKKEYEEEESKSKTKTASFLFESPRLQDPPPPGNLCRSDRFFISTGSSGSLSVDEASSSSTSAGTNNSSAGAEGSNNSSAAPEDFIALLTYSPSPYEDFRRSMKEMVDARMEHNGKVDWEFLEELLFCYLDLNNKKSYGFILRAFVDLIVSLRENPGKAPAIRRSVSSACSGRRRRLLK